MGNMVLRSSLIVIIALAGIFLKSFIPGDSDNTKKEFFTMQAVVKFLDRVHYSPKEMDDLLSDHVYDKYIKSLDAGKRFLTAQDIAKLEEYRFLLDDQIQNGSFDFLNLSVELIAKGILKAEQHYQNRINGTFNLRSEKSIMLNANSRGYAENDEALGDYWNRFIEYEVMTKVNNLIKARTDDDEVKSEDELLTEAIESVKKNFDDWFKRLSKLRRSDRFEDFLNAITSSFDPHSNYFSPKEKQDFDIEMNSTYEGIGARLTPDGELTKVSQIMVGGPAWKQKELEENDYIIMVAQEGEDPLDIRGMRLDDVITHIRGKKATKVILTVKKPDGTIRDITIVRDQVIIEEGKAKSVILGLEGTVDDIGYINLPKFYFARDGLPGCAEDVAKEIEKLQNNGVKGIILDLRYNGGGSLSEVVDMSGLFFENGPVVQVKSRGRSPYVLKDEDPDVQYSGPLMVLVNHFSASASEIIAAALQDYERAIIVGSSSTFGKGTVQRFHELDRFIVGNNDLKPLGEVKITTQKFYRVNGGSTQLRGVIPDIILPSPYNYVKVGEKDFETPLEWSEIDAVKFHQDVAALPDKNSLALESKKRVANHPTFTLIDERAKWLEMQEEDDKSYPIHLEEYQKILDEHEAKTSKFKNMFKPIESMKIENNPEDQEHLNGDENRKANNEDFKKQIKKDVYIEEALHIMRDMLARQ